MERILPFTCLFKIASGMLGHIVDSCSFAMVTFMGHFFFNKTHSLELYYVTFLVNAHVCGQGAILCFLRLGGPAFSASPPSLCAHLFGELLENSSSRRMATYTLFKVIYLHTCTHEYMNIYTWL